MQNERSRKLDDLESLCVYSRIPINEKVLKLGVDALERYTADQVHQAACLLLRNEERFSIKKLSDIIEDFFPGEESEPKVIGVMTDEQYAVWCKKIEDEEEFEANRE